MMDCLHLHRCQPELQFVTDETINCEKINEYCEVKDDNSRDGYADDLICLLTLVSTKCVHY